MNYKNFFKSLAIVLSIQACGVALAGDADFTLTNRTGYDIESVYITPSNSEN